MGGTIKQLTVENWRDADPVMAAFWRLDPLRGSRQVEAEEWAELILGIDLDPRAPEELRGLFMAARGVLLYGWFYYPLYMVGDEQLHRVAERAVALRAKQQGVPASHNNFKMRIDWLAEQGVIPADDVSRWHAIRGVRNAGTHPDFQHIAPPSWAVDTLMLVAEKIDQLFGFADAPPAAAV